MRHGVLNPWINVGRMNQMRDRAHRLATQHEVSVYWLVSANTIKAVALDVLSRTQQTSSALLDSTDSTEVPSTLTQADVDAMFLASPLLLPDL